MVVKSNKGVDLFLTKKRIATRQNDDDVTVLLYDE